MRSLDWAGGLFEGEGSIVTRPNRGSIQLTLYSTDQDVVNDFWQAVGVGFGTVHGPIRRTNKISSGPAKDMYEWRSYSSDAREVLTLLLPHFGRRRRERAILALSIPHKRQSRSRQ